jgi:two-component system invasion response regulator UvrY
MQSIIRVLLVDDHDLVRAGIKRILTGVSGIEVVGEAASGEQALQSINDLDPDVVLMDLKMPKMDGLQATKLLLKTHPHIKVLMVSVCLDDLLLPRLFQEGVSGYFSKGSSADEIIRAIRMVFDGQRYVSPAFIQQLNLKSTATYELSEFDELSEREFQVVLMIIQGQTIQDISEKLKINRKTINSYRTRSFQKLNIKNDVELTLLAVRQGLLKYLTPNDRI